MKYWRKVKNADILPYIKKILNVNIFTLIAEHKVFHLLFQLPDHPMDHQKES